MRDRSGAVQGLELSADNLAPVLDRLHACQEVRGFLAEADLTRVATEVGIAPAELYGAVSAYPRFRFEPGGPAIAVCGGPVCSMHGAADYQRTLGSADLTHCLGLCDQPVAALSADGPRVLTAQEPGVLQAPKLLSPGSSVEPTCFFGQDDPFEAVESALRRTPREVTEAVLESGLQGRGGAGFPTGRKWQMVQAAQGAQKVIICNADESEPGTFKDRCLLDHQPRRVLAGMAIAAYAVGARLGLIYLRYEYRPQYELLAREIARLRAEGRLGGAFDVAIRRGGGLYVCGEETALLNSLEGLRPIPRERPPYPPSVGLFGMPTLIQNVETLAAVPAIIAKGAAWFRLAGMPKLYCVSGDVANPGVFECPLGTTAADLVQRSGGSPTETKAFTLGGLSGGLLSADSLDLPLDFEHPREVGAYLGSGAVIVLDRRRCIVRFLAEAMRFFAGESCGKCFPCRIGTTRFAEQFKSLLGFNPITEEEVGSIGEVLATGSACGLGPAAALVASHTMRHFGEEISAHARGRCLSGECRSA